MGARRFVGTNLSNVGGSGRSRLTGTPSAVLLRAALSALLLVFALCGSAAAAGGDAVGGETGPFAAPDGEARPVPGPEVPQLRTRNSRTFRNDRGELVARIAGESVNYREGEAWRAISNDLVDTPAAGYAVQNEANDYRVLFPADLSGAPVRVSRGDAWVSFKLQGAAGAGRFAGSGARYADVLPGVSANYRVGNDSIKEDLVFSDARTPTVAFAVAAAEGLTPRATKGGVAFVDAAGDVRLTFARPFLYDAKGFEVPASRLTTRLERTGGGWTLEFAIDSDWLAKATGDGPVTLDPVVSTGSGQDCLIDSYVGVANNSFCSDPFIGAGYNAADHDHAALVKFNVRDHLPAGAQVYNARLYAYVEYAENSNVQRIGAHRMFGDWDNSATWNTRNGADGWNNPGGPQAGSDYASGQEDYTDLSSANAGGWEWWAQTTSVRGWMAREFEDRGTLLRSSTQSSSNYVQLSSMEDTATAPYLEVNYNPGVGRKPFWTFAAQTQLSDRDSLSVNVGSGNLLMESNDLSIPGTGVSNTVGRVYNSLPNDAYSSYGNVWKGTAGDEWHLWRDGGYEYTMMDTTGAAWELDRQSDGTWRAKGLKATLKRNADDSEALVYDESRTRVHFSRDRADEGRGADWIEDRNGNRITYTYNANGSVSSMTDTQGRAVTFGFTGSGIVERMTDSTGRVNAYGYDASEAIHTYTDPDGKQMRMTYASNEWGVNDDLLEITDYTGNKTKITYDTQHRVTAITRVTNPTTGAGDTTTFAYAQTVDDPCDPTVHIGKTIVTDPNGKATTFCYDAELRVTKSKDALGGVRDTAYDAQSNVKDVKSTAATTGTLGFNAAYAFNTDGALDTIDQGSGTGTKLTTRFAYTGAGNGGRYQPSETTSPQGNKTLFGYDPKGNLTSTKLDQTGGSEAVLEYDPAGKGAPTASTDPDGNRTTYGYDPAGNLTSITPPSFTPASGSSALGATTITYDSLSRVRTVRDGRNQTRTYDYDLRDRIKKITFGDSSSTTFTYDGNGATLSRADAPAAGLLGLTTILVDRKGRVTKETRPNGQATEYTYDGADNLKTLKDAGGTTLYGYGPTNLLATVQEPGVATPARFEYNGDGNRAKAILPNNVTITSPYDQAGRLQSIKTSNASSAVLQDLVYDYTKAGADTSLLQKVTDATPAGADNVTTYAYDGLDRLDTANTVGSNPSSYDYDLTRSGNRMKDVRKDPGATTATTTTYAYNPGNQLTSVNGSAANLTYDANGNQTKSPAAGTLAYNARDQITGITPPAGTLATLTHAGTSQNDLVSNAGSTLQNDGLGLASKTTGTSVTYYARTNDGGMISQRNGSTRRYMLTDERGSIVGLTDTAGTKTNTYQYDPYGRSIGTPHDTLGYAGGVRAPGGLTHYGARYYEAATGRWSQQDPINQVDDLRQANRYGYAGFDPINQTDPSGEIVPAIIAGRVATVAATAALKYGVKKYGARASGQVLKDSARKQGDIMTGKTAQTAGKVIDKASDYLDNFPF